MLIKTKQDSDGGVCLSVQDTGVGIEAESINKLFDVFYTTKNDGMGIGLSVSRSIIETMRAFVGHLQPRTPWSDVYILPPLRNRNGCSKG